jgi:hypothetical protein
MPAINGAPDARRQIRRPPRESRRDRAGARRADFAGASAIFVQKIGSVAAPCATRSVAGAAEMDSKADLC